MSAQNVIEALKQKLINEQNQNQNQNQPAQASPYSRSRREVSDPKETPTPSIPKASGHGTFGARERDIRGTRDTRDHDQLRDSRENDRDFNENLQSRGENKSRQYHSRNSNDTPIDARDNRGGSRYEPRSSYQPKRGSYQRDERDFRRDSREGDSRNYRDSRDFRDSRDYRDSRVRGYNSRERFPPSDGRRRREREDYPRFDRRSEPPRNLQTDYRDTDLTNVIPISKLPRKSFWDIKPKGFEKVSSEKAKISGLFPLPGEARRLDVSKLEGLVQSGVINSQVSILFEETKIGSIYSRISKQLIITGVEFTLFPVEKLIESLTAYIKSLNLEESYLVNHELFNNKQLVIHLSNNNVATILYASELYLQKKLNLNLRLQRPANYITPIPETEESKEEEQSVKIRDSEKKLCIRNVPSDIKEDEILEDLQEIGRVQLIDLVKTSEGESTGICFVEFKDTDTVSAIEQINKIVIGEVTLSAKHASRGLINQESNISYRSFPKLVQNNSLTKSNVLILLNAVDPESLKQEANYQQLLKDIEEECSNYGSIESIKIPKPESNYKRNLKNIHTNVGKIFVKFSNIKEAQKAASELQGKQYMTRTILVSFIPESDYDLNIL